MTTSATEQDARTRRCCGPEGCGHYVLRATASGADRYCLASGCMAWRWNPTRCGRLEFTGDRGPIVAPRHTPVETMAYWRETFGEPVALPDEGYCGLAAS
jgi:hypothetical protein